MKDPGTNRIRAAAAQYFIRPITTFEQFEDQVSAIVEAAASYHCRLLVLPEYFTLQLAALNDIHRPFPEQVREVASCVPRFVALMSKLARENGLYVVAGTIPVVEGTDGPIHNDAYFFAPSGKHAVQGKLHMTRTESEDWGVAERPTARVFDTELGRIGIAICYDAEFPELVREMARQGVRILCVPSATDNRYGFLRVRYCAHARAIENQLYVIHAATVGGLPRVPDVSLNYGEAAILTPSDFEFARDGILAQGNMNQEDLIIGELDMGLIDDSRAFGTVRPLSDSDRRRVHTYEIDLVEL
ncbi:MAG TPA: carbon-nitrogen hydrolase family protein [Rhodothermales bacterium]|nr:carbon-nitrogen hydrolase family protein [Rhodothermales bacterium]